MSSEQPVWHHHPPKEGDSGEQEHVPPFHDPILLARLEAITQLAGGLTDRVAVMDRGRIVQVGSPREVYRAPATPFVADFVGLMNFLPGVMMASRVAQVRCGGALLQVPDHIPGLSPGREVMVAIRPEDVRILHNGLDLTNILETKVHEIEFLGPFHRLHLRVLQQNSYGCALNLTAYLDPAGQTRPIHQGAPLAAHLPVEALRVYPTQA